MPLSGISVKVYINYNIRHMYKFVISAISYYLGSSSPSIGSFLKGFAGISAFLSITLN